MRTDPTTNEWPPPSNKTGPRSNRARVVRQPWQSVRSGNGLEGRSYASGWRWMLNQLLQNVASWHVAGRRDVRRWSRAVVPRPGRSRRTHAASTAGAAADREGRSKSESLTATHPNVAPDPPGNGCDRGELPNIRTRGGSEPSRWPRRKIVTARRWRECFAAPASPRSAPRPSRPEEAGHVPLVILLRALGRDRLRRTEGAVLAGRRAVCSTSTRFRSTRGRRRYASTSCVSVAESIRPNSGAWPTMLVNTRQVELQPDLAVGAGAVLLELKLGRGAEVRRRRAAVADVRVGDAEPAAVGARRCWRVRHRTSCGLVRRRSRRC